MKLRFVAVVVALFAFVSMMLIAVLLRPAFIPSIASNTGTGTLEPQSTISPFSKVTMLENAHQGTTGWIIPVDKESTTQIQAYASATSVQAGQRLTFYVSTQREETPYSLDIYRIGWYGGLGGRLMFEQKGLIGHAQGYYDSNAQMLVNCNSCEIDRTIGLVEANWKPSYTVTVSSSWNSGVYLAKFTDASGMQTYAPFDVRGNSHSLYIAVTPDATYAAYNIWGGYSLYAVDKTASLNETTQLPRGAKVSFDRPNVQWVGGSEVLPYEAPAIRWIERQGYDISYMSDIDLHEHPELLLQHHVYISLGHDEYWSKEMRDGVEQARDNGVGLAFLGANDAYWQIRLEPDSAGTPDRTVVCYKVGSQSHDLNRDPLYRKDNSRVTTQWRDPVIGRPENALIGIMYTEESWDTAISNFPPWQVSSTTNSSLFDGTGLQADHQYGCDLTGYEWDHVINNGATPVGLQLLGKTQVSSKVNNISSPSDTTYYVALSGAMVFATGSVYWTFALDSYRFDTNKLCSSQNLVVPGMQKLMANVMSALLVHYAPAKIVLSNSTLQRLSLLFPLESDTPKSRYLAYQPKR